MSRARPPEWSRRWRTRSAWSSARLLENLATDQHATNLAGAGADLVQLGVAQQPPGREFVDVAIAAEALDRFQCHPRCTLRCIEDRASGVLARRAAGVAGARHRIDVGLRCVH